MTAMLRARQSGRPCRIHGAWCEVSAARATRTRAQENRVWRKDIARA